MDGFKKFEKKNIEKILLDNFIDLMPPFYEMESSFLTGIYERYGDLEGGNIVIFFAKDLHLEILRKREIDLNFNLSLDKFWNNHKNIIQKKKKIITIAKSTGLPRETTRRKILSLIKTKHIKKTEKNTIFWEPDSRSKDSYIKIIEQQVSSLSKFIFQQLKFLSLNIPISKIEKEIKNNYSFYWYHYLNTQLQYIKLWQVRFKDLEMLLIGLQTLIQSIGDLKNLNRLQNLDSFLLAKTTKSTNPFNNQTNILIDLPKESYLAIKIYNLKGELVRALLDEKRSAGNYSINWDGKGDHSSYVSSGTYLLQIRTENYNKISKIILLK